MTSETQDKTDPWVKDLGAKYAYAYDKGRKLMPQLGLSGYPSAALVDPSGIVVWTGHPSGLKDELIEKHLGGALPKPMFTWPKSAKAVRSAMRKGKLGAAIKAAAKLEKDPEASTLHGDLKSVAAGYVESLRSQVASGDYLAATNTIKRLKKSLSGLPEAKEVDAAKKELAGIKGHKAVIKAQRAVRKIITGRVARKKDCDEIIEQLRRIEKKNSDNVAGKEAATEIARFENMKRRFRN